MGFVSRTETSYRCATCVVTYPILFGIPDFRLRSDRYLSIEEEREKAGRLYEYGITHTFDELVAFYYTITDDVPPSLAQRYLAYIHNSCLRANASAISLDLDSSLSRVLDVGCGAGGFLVAAAGQCKELVGVDIALRWLVICKKRLDEHGIDAMLVCADVESMPFQNGVYTHIYANDLIEHVYSVGMAVAAMTRHLSPDGKLWISGNNRFCLGPHASTRIWGLGYLPRLARKKLLIKLRGIDSIRFSNLVSPLQIIKIVKKFGLEVIKVQPRQISSVKDCDYPLQDRVLLKIYRIALKIPLLASILVLIGPAFEILVKKGVLRTKKF